PAVNRAAVKEMHRQVGDLIADSSGVAVRGLLVRHLVLPNGLAGTEDILRFLATEISRDTYVNIMDQYHPCFKANQMPELSRRITATEYREALHTAQRLGLHRGF
ncbi:MAG: radical SAM protein, partial [Chloroflexota bacterium]